MLMIKVFVNQSVIIEDGSSRYTLKLLASDSAGVVMQLDEQGKLITVKRFVLLLNEQTTLLPSVKLLLRQTGNLEALLGFDAPRRIKIHGSWKREPSQCNTQLSSLTDKELVVHTHQLGKTDLEIELAKRLESKRGTL